jgi:hypothetical protein
VETKHLPFFSSPPPFHFFPLLISSILLTFFLLFQITEYLPDVQSMRHRFLTVHAAVTPTRVLPAPDNDINKNCYIFVLQSIHHLETEGMVTMATYKR